MSDLYRQMLRIRMVEERIAQLYPEQEIRCPVHLCIGQEASAVGAISALRPDDYVFSNHRSHGHYLAKGGDLKRMMAELYGKGTGCTGGMGGSMHLIDKSVNFMGAVPVVGSILPIAAGCAFASKLKGDDRVTMVFIGDAVAECGAFHETLNFAVLHKLPLIIVCENNHYSVNSRIPARQPSYTHISGLAKAAGCYVYADSGMKEPRWIRRHCWEAIDHARKGTPAFMEYVVYRYHEHCGPALDDGRPEYKTWKWSDPIKERDLEMVAEITAEIDEAVAFAKSSSTPRVMSHG